MNTRTVHLGRTITSTRNVLKQNKNHPNPLVPVQDLIAGTILRENMELPIVSTDLRETLSPTMHQRLLVALMARGQLLLDKTQDSRI